MFFTIERLREIFEYNSDTGEFRWRVNAGRNKTFGKPAGSWINGYRELRHCGCRIRAHRAAWAMYYGVMPELEIDHIDCDRSNNKITNLREATSGQNNYNVVSFKNNTSGFKGVSWAKRERLWRADICKERHRVTLGYFKTKEEAALAYNSAAIVLFGNFANVNGPSANA